MTTDVLSVLTKARALISKPENWCQHSFSESNDGTISYCARGAIFEFLDCKESGYEKRYDEPYCAELARALPTYWFNSPKPRGFSGLVADYNNTNTHTDVIAIFDETIARLKREKTISELASIKDDAVSELETV